MNQDNELPQMLLSDAQLEQLDECIEQLSSDEEDADLYIALGYLTAQALPPETTSPSQWLAQLFAEPSNTEASQTLVELFDLAVNAAKKGFYQGGGIELPFELDLATESDEIADWCAGFMQAVIEQEDNWFASQEKDMAELLLPIMALSGLFADEPEFIEIDEDPQLMAQLAKQLPDLLLDIYCQFNAPEEKPKTRPLIGNQKKNRRR
ncbi:YecA family protein [Marinospirillum insulare]|uniref:YecA family protein n=1 Tax=Marinospirillum insulare TaxID=217169 RepID=A0ABQ5ZVE9_9GAMM|nr:YecA family protein [Marinospirillum insulare]GLR63431.1 hypothetical protein GCM10007878_08660 [Marinospirillum insulare]